MDKYTDKPVKSSSIWLNFLIWMDSAHDRIYLKGIKNYNKTYYSST